MPAFRRRTGSGRPTASSGAASRPAAGPGGRSRRYRCPGRPSRCSADRPRASSAPCCAPRCRPRVRRNGGSRRRASGLELLPVSVAGVRARVVSTAQRPAPQVPWPAPRLRPRHHWARRARPCAPVSCGATSATGRRRLRPSSFSARRAGGTMPGGRGAWAPADSGCRRSPAGRRLPRAAMAGCRPAPARRASAPPRCRRR